MCACMIILFMFLPTKEEGIRRILLLWGRKYFNDISHILINVKIIKGA